MDETGYLAPKDLDEVFKTVEDTKAGVKFIAGGTNVIPNLRAEKISPELLIDLTALEGLSHVREENGAISIGALTTISEVASSGIIRDQSPILFSAANRLGNPLTRNRATIGGNLADASPAADMAPPLLALDALIHTEQGGGKGREISLEKFFLGPNNTVLEEGEIITRITFPKPKDPNRGHFIKLGLRNAMAISVVSIAVMLELEGKICRKSRVALGAVAPKPMRAYGVEKALEGSELDQEAIEKCASVLTKEISPISDIRASSDYRKMAAKLGATDVKNGCGKGDCGACAVILDGKAVNACLTLALQANGKEVITLRGIGTEEKPHPLQKSFVERGAIQCGFCTPGQILTAKALLDRNPKPDREEIREAISGNLCRCTGYNKIVDAIEHAADEGHGKVI
jgi:carbon-monoxide dehydrogenase medium subunit